MSYRVEFGGGAQVQFHSLPEDARDALVERAVELADEPWDATVRPPGVDTRFHKTVFGVGHGLLGFYTFAAASGARLRDLMPRMGHDSERAAMIYQHEARGADQAIMSAIDSHVQAEQRSDEDDDGQAGVG